MLPNLSYQRLLPLQVVQGLQELLEEASSTSDSPSIIQQPATPASDPASTSSTAPTTLTPDDFIITVQLPATPGSNTTGSAPAAPTTATSHQTSAFRAP